MRMVFKAIWIINRVKSRLLDRDGGEKELWISSQEPHDLIMIFKRTFGLDFFYLSLILKWQLKELVNSIYVTPNVPHKNRFISKKRDVT